MALPQGKKTGDVPAAAQLGGDGGIAQPFGGQEQDTAALHLPLRGSLLTHGLRKVPTTYLGRG